MNIIKISCDKSATILDFFAGSGTTGHAVLKLNAEDGGNRRFILCTNNENNICEEVTYERIKRVIEGYGDTEGIPSNLKYYRTDFVSKDSDSLTDKLLDHIKEIMGTSMEALIHHFKLVTEGFRVPAGQVYAAIESPRGELGYHVVSDGGTRPFRVHVRDPSFTNLQATAAMSEGGMIADVIAAIASIDPVMGGVDR